MNRNSTGLNPNSIGPYSALKVLETRSSDGAMICTASDRLTGMPVLLHILSQGKTVPPLDDLRFLPIVEVFIEEGKTVYVSELLFNMNLATNPMQLAVGGLTSLRALHDSGHVHGYVTRGQFWQNGEQIHLAGAGIPWQTGAFEPHEDIWAFLNTLESVAPFPPELKNWVSQMRLKLEKGEKISAQQALDTLLNKDQGKQQLQYSAQPVPKQESKMITTSEVLTEEVANSVTQDLPLESKNMMQLDEEPSWLLGDSQPTLSAQSSDRLVSTSVSHKDAKKRILIGFDEPLPELNEADVIQPMKQPLQEESLVDKDKEVAKTQEELEVSQGLQRIILSEDEEAVRILRARPVKEVNDHTKILTTGDDADSLTTNSDDITSETQSTEGVRAIQFREVPRMPEQLRQARELLEAKNQPQKSEEQPKPMRRNQREPIRIGWDEDDSWRVMKGESKVNDPESHKNNFNKIKTGTSSEVTQKSSKVLLAVGLTGLMILSLVIAGLISMRRNSAASVTSRAESQSIPCCEMQFLLGGKIDTPVELNVVEAPKGSKLKPGTTLGKIPNKLRFPIKGKYRLRVLAKGYKPEILTVQVPATRPLKIILAE